MEKEKSDAWERARKVTDNINRASWKLKGIAGLLCIEEQEGSITLSTAQANGLSMLIEGLAEEIETNANLITEVQV